MPCGSGSATVKCFETVEGADGNDILAGAGGVVDFAKADFSGVLP